MSTPRRAGLRVLNEGARVTSLELFFDLVFVFAITQVSELMAHDPRWTGVLHGMLMLALLWWCWCCYSWMGNRVQADEGLARLVLFAVTLVMLVASVTIPEAFHDLPGGLSGPVVFACCYLVVRVLHLVFYWLFSVGDAGLRRQLVRAAVPMGGGAALLFAASFVPAHQTLLWVLALAVDYGGVLAIGAAGWSVRSASHFAERHGLIIIIALGESVVSIGVGVSSQPISWPIIFGIACGLVIAGTLWWSYFDVVAPVAERVLTKARGARRSALARDSYTYLHLPMVAGIVLLSLGLKQAMSYLGGVHGASGSARLVGIPLYAMYGGVALYLVGHFGFRLRNVGSVNWARVVVTLLLVALVPVAAQLPVFGSLGLLTAVCVGWIGYEVLRYDDFRRSVRTGEHEHGESDMTDQTA
ncbi:low temperature requirement protein A [Solihabitans fulvus]|uniref:Low temperature requirement protein A n=1 Tax=Solihabitans fulvus TaxID=1892852 RepID=A0A5B2XHR4_9PSEU|nr:low temperature requirement protein A [Solihabitans fulvus]KAA2262441.1 low temperature requirement protein A [Solihabitans fulvus]